MLDLGAEMQRAKHVTNEKWIIVRVAFNDVKTILDLFCIAQEPTNKTTNFRETRPLPICVKMAFRKFSEGLNDAKCPKAVDFSGQLQMASNIRIQVGSWLHQILTTIRPSQICFLKKKLKKKKKTLNTLAWRPFPKSKKWTLLEINT